MSRRPLRPCLTPGCPVLVETGRCPRHQALVDARRAEDRQAYDAARGDASDRGYDAEWRRLRDSILAAVPLCRCGARATEVHHVLPVKVRADLRLDPANLVSICHGCHVRVTRQEARA